MSALHSDPLTTSCVLLFMWSHIWPRDQHISNQVHMRTLARIILSELNPTWKIRTCGFAGVVDLWTWACFIWEKKCVFLHVSVNWHPNTSLSTLEQGLAENRSKHIYSVTHIQSLFVTPITSGYLKNLQVKPSLQGSWRVRSESLLPFLKIVDTTNGLTVSLVNPLTARTPRDSVCAYQSLKNTPEIFQLYSQ